MDFKQFLKKVLKQLNPLPPIGGLEISDSAIRFVLIKNSQLIQANIRLTPGIIEAGIIKDRVNLISVLKNIRSQVNQSQKIIYAILIVPPKNVYVQTFNIPFLVEEQIEEAAKLNLQMISPIDVKTAYSGWQKIGETPVDGGRFEILGAFAESKLIEDYISVVKEAGFKVAAVEFPALSLTRLIAQLGAEINISEPHHVLQVSSEGIAIMIMRGGNLYFNHFNSWRAILEEIGKRELTIDDFKEYLIKEVQRIMNFYSTHWGGSVNKLILVSEALTNELIKTIEANFPMKVFSLALKDYKGFSSAWFPVLGAGLRGLIPRSLDNFISLMAVGIQKEYFRSRFFNFVVVWRNIVLTVFVFIFAIVMIFDGVLWRTERRVKESVASAFPFQAITEINQLKTEAINFNNLVSLAYKAKDQTIDWSPLVKKIQNLVGDRISLERFYIDSAQKIAMINGRAANDTEIINFKNNLLKEENFFDINLPLAAVKIRPDGSADFSVTFKLRALKF
jgi:Tfp pilus assembly PilM family ATPase